MKLEHSFSVPVPPDAAWRALLDVERIAPCMPGATLTEVSGDEFRGTVKVKVGPITVTYGGTARFVEKDEVGHRVVIEGKGRETRGAGTAQATITGTLIPEGDGTRVDVATDLAITGKPAQFGRGVMADVGAKIIGQFADCLQEELAAPAERAAEEPTGEPVPQGEPALSAAPTSPDADRVLPPYAAPTPEQPSPAVATTPPLERPTTAPTPRAVPVGAAGSPPRRTPEAIDLLGVAGAPLAKRLAPALAALAVLAAILVVWRRRR